MNRFDCPKDRDIDLTLEFLLTFYFLTQFSLF